MDKQSTHTCLWHAKCGLFFQCNETARELSQVTLEGTKSQFFPPQNLQWLPDYRESCAL